VAEACVKAPRFSYVRAESIAHALALLKQGDKQGAREEAGKALKNASQPDEQTKIRSFVNQIG